MAAHSLCSFFFFFNDTATTEIYTLSLHDALPISRRRFHALRRRPRALVPAACVPKGYVCRSSSGRSEEHTSELQSRLHLVCRLLLEKKKSSTTPTSSPPRTASPGPRTLHQGRTAT